MPQTSMSTPTIQRVQDTTPDHDQNALFTGNAPMGTQAVALFRYCRVMTAIGAYEEEVDIQVRVNKRMRWTVGMHRELVRLIFFNPT